MGPITHAESFYGLIGESGTSGIRFQTSGPNVRVSSAATTTTMTGAWTWNAGNRLMIHITANSANVTGFENGVQISNPPHATNDIVLNSLFAQFGTSDFMWAGPTLQILVFNRFFSQEDAKARFADPFAIYRRPAKVLRFDPAVGAAPAGNPRRLTLLGVS